TSRDRLRCTPLPAPAYQSRPKGSTSEIRSIHDVREPGQTKPPTHQGGGLPISGGNLIQRVSSLHIGRNFRSRSRAPWLSTVARLVSESFLMFNKIVSK